MGTAALSALPARAAEPVQQAAAFSLKVLSVSDAAAYGDAFLLMRQGRFAEAEAAAARATNPTLRGRVAFAKLMHPDYRSSFEELSDWLRLYRDQPEATRIYSLAMRRRPTGAPAPLAPTAVASTSTTWELVESHAERIEARRVSYSTDEAGQLAAREAFYGGDVETARALAETSGERWIAGLSAFQAKDFDTARARFADLAEASDDDWVRSAAAYWAARSAIAGGDPETAPRYLAIAARTPYTFYGLIAERQLGLEPAIGPQGLDPSPLPSRSDGLSTRAPVVTGVDGAALARLVRGDARAARAAAFAQIGMRAEAGREIRLALDSAGADARRAWTQLGLALNAPITSETDLVRPGRTRFDIAQFPTPELTPNGGFTLDRALVYALVRQESRFNPEAKSAVGAQGLMQLMPATAAKISGDAKLARDPAPLKDPAVNLRVGQDYVARLLEVTNGDLLHAVAAYNAGPGSILRTLSRLGADADSLMAIESMPGAQTREFVEKVVAGYWIYRSLFGQDSRTLDAVASGAKSVRAALDLPGPARHAEASVLSSFLNPAR